MWLFILAAYYYYCESMGLETYCNHNPPTGSTFRSMRLGNETWNGKLRYMCLKGCIYQEGTKAYRPERFGYIFQGFGAYDGSIQAEGLLCVYPDGCIWNYSMRTPQLTRTLQPTKQLAVQSTRPKKIKTALAVFYQLVFIA